MQLKSLPDALRLSSLQIPDHPVEWKSATRHIVLILTPCARRNP